MGKPLPKFGPYTVIVDTNALFTPEPRKLVSSKFESSLAELRKLATAHLIIPQVVIGELAYRKYLWAKAAVESTNSKLDGLAELTGATRPRFISVDQARRRIVKRYQVWCKSVGARQFVPKVKQAIWNSLVEDAVWRIPPFEHSDDGKHEKGFRDRVVLESLLQNCTNQAHETVFLTEDGLLKSAVAGRNLKNLAIHPRLEDFTSRVRLLKEKAEEEWVELFFSEATRAFYERDNRECLYLKENVFQRITERVEELKPPPAEAFMAVFEPSTWDRQTEERITLGTTQYESGEAGRLRWKTDVKSAAAFSGKGLLGTLEEKIRISTFAVYWSSQSNNDAEIKDAKFESIALTGRQMIPDNSDARNQWALPAKPIPVPQLYALEELLKGLPNPPAN